MKKDQYYQMAERLLEKAGITINGSGEFDLRVNDPRLFKRVLGGGTLALGEAYLEGWWDCPRLDEFFTKVLKADLRKSLSFGLKDMTFVLGSVLMNLQSKSRAFQVGERHYDLGNDLYGPMLGSSMAYSCGYWKNVDTLDAAQEAKFDLICRKMHLKKGMKVLDIGCGWGTLAEYMAKNYEVEVTGITVSREQLKYARERCKDLPVKFELIDYRSLNGKFDVIVSVGMFEHVGLKNYHTYFKQAADLLDKRGLFLLHTIGGRKPVKMFDPWLHKYIFPNALLPAVSNLSSEAEKYFVMEDWHNFGPYYDRTLMAWWENFEKVWPELQPKYGDRFYRIWKYYLQQCAGLFRARECQLWQIVLSKGGVLGGYNSVR